MIISYFFLKLNTHKQKHNNLRLRYRSCESEGERRCRREPPLPVPPPALTPILAAVSPALKCVCLWTHGDVQRLWCQMFIRYPDIAAESWMYSSFTRHFLLWWSRSNHSICFRDDEKVPCVFIWWSHVHSTTCIAGSNTSTSPDVSHLPTSLVSIKTHGTIIVTFTTAINR